MFKKIVLLFRGAFSLGKLHRLLTFILFMENS
jgi:hypothetical protein